MTAGPDLAETTPNTIPAEPPCGVWGATPDDWEALTIYAGLVADVLPVVSSPHAVISPDSAMAALGKTPSDYNRSRQARGLKNWTQRVSTFEDVEKWERMGDYGICLQTRSVRAIDVDVDDAQKAREIAHALRDMLGEWGVAAPVRTRSNSGKFLVAIRVAPGQNIPKRRMPVNGGVIEFLATGQQFVAVGTHPSGVRYEWAPMEVGAGPTGTPESFPEISLEQFEDLWSILRQSFAVGADTTGGTDARQSGAHLDLDDPLADWLRESGLVLGETPEGGLNVGCPWESEHSSGRAGDGSSTYFPAGMRGYAQGAYVCLHAHCSGRTTRQFRQAVGFVAERAPEDEPEALFGPLQTAEERERVLVQPDLTGAERTEELLAKLRNQILAVPTVAALERSLTPQIQRMRGLTDIDRERLAQCVQQRTEMLGAKIPIATARRLVARDNSYVHDDPLSWVTLDENNRPLCTIENVEVLMRRYGVSMRYNMISREMDAEVEGMPFDSENQANSIIDTLISFGVKERMPGCSTLMPGMVQVIAARNRYNPVADWIESREWDGVDRLGELVKTLEVDTRSGFDVGLAELIIRKWMIQGVAVVLAPDGKPCSTRGVLVFAGEQNIGKSRWVQRLVGGNDDWFLAGHSLDAHNKDSVKLAISKWICELGELGSTFRKSDIDALKAFLTREVDRFRLPYARTESKFQRRTNFYASVNDGKFLMDPTGNTRFWVIPVLRVDHDHKVDMQQLWAQMAAAWRAGEQHWLTDEQMGSVSKSSSVFQVEDPIREALGAQFDLFGALEDPEKYDWMWITATEIVNKLQIAGTERATAQRVGRTLRTVAKLQHKHTMVGQKYLFPVGVRGSAVSG